MSSTSTLAFLDQLGATKSKNEKLYILKSATPEDREFIQMAMNPFITYGLAKPIMPADSGPHDIDDETVNMLGRMASRVLTGSAMKTEVDLQLRRLNVESQELLRRIFIKDLRCGTGVTLINEVWPDLIPVFKVQLSEVYNVARCTSWPMQFQRKLDGMRAVAVIDLDENTVCFVSREGLAIDSLDHIAEILKSKLHIFANWQYRRIMLDGEATAGSFNDTVSQVKGGGKKGKKKAQAEDAVFNMFDIFYEHGNGDTQHSRTAQVQGIAAQYANPKIGFVPAYQVDNDDDIMNRVNDIWDEGGEGGMVKDLMAHYQRRRGWSWMKIKKRDSAEFKVVSIFAGSGAYEHTAGGFVVELENGRHARTSGIKEAMRDEIWEQREAMPGRLIEIAFHERTPDGSFRHPRFVKFRDTQTGSKE